MGQGAVIDWSQRVRESGAGLASLGQGAGIPGVAVAQTPGGRSMTPGHPVLSVPRTKFLFFKMTPENPVGQYLHGYHKSQQAW